MGEEHRRHPGRPRRYSGWAKNDALGFEILSLRGGWKRKYVSDLLIHY